MLKISNKAIEKVVPTDYLATRQVTDTLLDYFSLKNERELLDKLECDFYYLSFRDLSQNESCVPFYRGPELKFSEDERICPLGIKWKRTAYNDKFGVDEARKGALPGFSTTEQDVLKLRLPKAAWFDFSLLAEECESFADKIIVGGLWSGIHGDSYRLMGYEEFLLNFAMNKELIKMLVDKMTDFYLELNNRYFEALKGKMEIFFMGNDFGSQNGLLISKEDWYEVYYENYKKLINLAHSYDLSVMVHSCGSIEPLLPWFIELGVDIVDPVQLTASSMEPSVLAEKYGKDICFHGAIDTQQILPYGSTEEVKEHVLSLIDKLNTGNNYIAAPANNIMPGTPARNIEMAYETLSTKNKKA